MRVKSLILAGCLAAGVLHGATGKVLKGIYYGPKNATEYQQEKCKLDIYLPKKTDKKFPVLIYFHGGGLTGGKRGGPMNVMANGIALVAPSYRLYPKVKCPAYLEDAAAAVAWTFKNIAKYGGDPNQIYVGGMSAGSYLTAMLGMDKSWLKAQGIDADKIAGLIPDSGHMITHFTVRKERGISNQCGLCDELAPMFHIRKTPFPIFIQCGDNDFPSRQEENKLFVSMMIRYARQPKDMIFYKEYPGTHGSFFRGAPQKDLCRFIMETSGLAKKTQQFMAGSDNPSLPKIAGRVFDGKLYIDSSDKNADILFFDNNTPLKATGSNGVYTAKVPAANTDKLTAKLQSKVSVKLLPETKVFTLNSGTNGIEMTMKKGSKLLVKLDDKNLYITLNTSDKTLTPANGGSLWTGDALEIFVDQAPLKNLHIDTFPNAKFTVNQYIIAAVPSTTGDKAIMLLNGGQGKTQATCKTEKTSDGYCMNVEIPLSELPELKKANTVVGMTFQRCTGSRAQGKEFLYSTKPAHQQRSNYPLFKINPSK